MKSDMFKNLNFVRWGNLYQKKGKAISTNPFHEAPCNFGIYAFPQFYTESFLVNWKYCDDEILLPKIKKIFKEKYNIDEIDFDNQEHYDLYWKIEDSIVKKEKKKDYKVIKYRGYVWHHFLNESKSTIRKGSWVCDTYNDYIKCLKKHIHECYKTVNEYSKEIYKDNILNCVRKTYAKDEFEVYLCDKIK